MHYNLKFAIHNYRPFSSTRPSPVRLTGAIGNNQAGSPIGIVPEGDGYLHLPAPNKRGFLHVHVYYSPQLNSTLVNEHDLLGNLKASRLQYSGISFDQYFSFYTCHSLSVNFCILLDLTLLYFALLSFTGSYWVSLGLTVPN